MADVTCDMDDKCGRTIVNFPTNFAGTCKMTQGTHGFTMMALSWLHVLIWLFVMFGGLLHRNVAVANMLIALPIIFVVQAMPMHPINTAKMLEVKAHGGKTGGVSAPRDRPHPRELCDRKHHARMLGMPIAEYDRAKRQVDGYATSIALNSWVFRLRRKLNDWSFANPLSAQGLIVLSFIANSQILFWAHRRL